MQSFNFDSMEESYNRRKESKRNIYFTKMDLAILSFTIISVALIINVYIQYGYNIEVFYGPNELYSKLINQSQNLSAKVHEDNRTINQLQNQVNQSNQEVLILKNNNTSLGNQIIQLKTQSYQQQQTIKLYMIEIKGNIKSVPFLRTCDWINFSANGISHIVPVKDNTYDFSELKNNQTYFVSVKLTWWLFSSTESLGVFQLSSNEGVIQKDWQIP